VQKKEQKMFGKKDDNDQVLPPTQQVHRATPMLSGGQPSTDQASVICRGMTVVGKIFGEGTVQVFGRIEGELKALTVSITESAEVDGDIVAEELSVAGLVKGTIHANRVKLSSTAVVEGDIFHRSLSIEENARFEGSSKRENDPIDLPRISLRAEATQDTARVDGRQIEGGRKSNGHEAVAESLN
jgi:cytoskeletal protein CcmA (bactofilin family)